MTPSSEVKRFFSPGSLLAQRLPGYETREGQAQMMEVVSSAIAQSQTLLVEAPTGTGKSLAYLIPALLTGRKVVVSTATRTLQDQLFHKELPFIQDELQIPFEAALLKGRTNYLCLHLLEQSAQQAEIGGSQRDWILRLLTWSQQTATGDRRELEDLPDDAPIWSQVSTGAEGCLGQRCAFFEECFVVKARRRAAQADLVVVNHHLLFADLSLQSSVGITLLPALDILILDEAHGLEDVAAQHFGQSVSDRRIRQLAGDAHRAFRDQPGAQDRLGRLKTELLDRSDRFFASFRPLFPKTRLTPELLPEDTKEHFFLLDDTLADLFGMLQEHREASEAIQRLAERCTSLRGDLDTLVGLRERSLVTWVEKGPRATFLKAAPIDVSPIIRDVLRPRCEALILTSATLSTGGNFNHVKARLGLDDETMEAILPSPFDYEQQALLYVAESHPPPHDPGFVDAVSETVLRLIKICRGHALILFTSIRNMRQVSDALKEQLTMPVYVQGDGSREVLLERFRAQADSVLFATGSFWEGVDVRGEALSLLVIDKLPFAPPDEPLTSARIEAVAREGKNAFMEYQVPMAIIALKQGFGRLIRHRLDRGIVAVCDPRLTSKPYGKRFLRSLPEARRVQDLDALEAQWNAWQKKVCNKLG